MKKIANLLSIYSLLFGSLLFVKNKAPGGFALWFPKLLAGALAPFNALAGALGAVLGLLAGSPLALLTGLVGAAASARYTQRAVAPAKAGSQGSFSRAFGPGWEGRIPAELRPRLLPQRWAWCIPASPEPCWQQDLTFWTLSPNNGGQPRRLLFDLWQPPAGVAPTGLAFIYFHGSAWYMMDKDINTRPFFRHLVAQGHVVMDVAYRLAPETDMTGMLGDVKRAVSWMKDNAGRYGVNSERLVLGGGSAGGQLSLLAAYTPDNPDLTPPELLGRDLSVRAVISEYGPADLAACYKHTNQDKTTRNLAVWFTGEDSLPPAPADPQPENEVYSRWARRLLGSDFERWGLNKSASAGAFVHLLGCHPDQHPERYARFSPLAYVHPGCPPTLLIQGEDDLITPVEATCLLYRKLVEAGVPVVNVVFPQTEHGFDLMLPEISPTAQAALYDIERFLALMV